jgi:hypothetical protein
MKKTFWTLKALAIATAFLALIGCNALSRNTDSSSMIVIQSITGTTTGGETVAYLQSDVMGNDDLVRADNALATIIIRLVNPDPIDGPSQFNDVVLTSYTVTFELPAGGGTPGADVPQPFEGNFSTVLCPVDESTEIPFMVVPETAKTSAPLSALVDTSGIIEVKAKIEIVGHDLSNKEVKATGYLTIYFADYQDVAPLPK